MRELTREVKVLAAWDRTNADPSKNYGVHGCDLCFYLKGPEGAVQFIIYTQWQLPHVQAQRDADPLNQFPYMFHKPLPADIGYHSKIPRYEGQEPLTEHCEFTDGGPCYYDGSSLYAEEGFKILVAEGSEGLWKWMEDYYRDRLCSQEAA